MRWMKPASYGVVVLIASTCCHADFKYTQSSKVTGGSLMTMTKTLGVFSKNARQITEPQLSTIMLKGNRMRSEHANGQVEIIDLDARRFINVDTVKKTYSTMTFDEFKAAMQRAQDKAKEEQAKAAAKNPDAANVKMTPKFTATDTGATKTVLNLPTKEVKWRMDMEVQATDAKAQQQMQNAAMTMSSDAWIASSVPGYDEMHQFYIRLAKELNWLPGMMSGMMGTNPQMGSTMQEFQKNAVNMKGMPLLQFVTMGMSATPAPQNTAAAQQAPPPQQQPSATPPTSTSDAISKGISGLFGGFGKKKKQDEQPGCQTTPSTDACDANPAGTGGGQTTASLMDMQIEVTSYSTSSLDGSLFDIPAGFTQVQKDPNQMFGGK